MMLPICCQEAIEAGKHEAHALVCPHRPPAPAEEPETEPLFDLEPPVPAPPVQDSSTVSRTSAETPGHQRTETTDA